MNTLAGEGGQTVVLVLALLVIALGLAAAGVAETLSSSQLTSTDARARRAQQAADAGIQAQLYQQSEADLGSNSYNFNGGLLGGTVLGGASTFLDCTLPQLNASGQVAGIVSFYANTAGVCPQAVNNAGTGGTAYEAALGDHTSYSAEMITGQTLLLGGAERVLNPKIVSIGAETSTVPVGSATVHSREEAILAPIAPVQAVEGMGAGSNSVTLNGLSVGLSLLGISLVNINTGSAVLNGNVLARGTINLPSNVFVGLNLAPPAGGSFLATVAGQAITGGAVSVANEQQGVGSQVVQRSPIIVADSKADCPTAGCPTGYNTTTRIFSQTSNVNTTFAPGDYAFCSFNATNGTLSTTGTGPVRIFIRSPTSTDCAADSTDPNLGKFNSTVGFNDTLTGIVNGLNPSGLQIYNAGSGSVTVNNTNAAACSTTGLIGLSLVCLTAKVPIDSMIIYAPSSSVSVNTSGCLVNALVLSVCSAGVFEGAVVGNTDTISATAITQDLDIGNFPLYAGVNAFRVTQFVQCDNSVTSLTQSTADLGGC
jgi:hypothetical protein